MQARVQIQYYGNKIYIMRFLDYGYYIRKAQFKSKTDWELRYYTESNYAITKIDDTIGSLLDIDESELFQKSCIEDYDVWLVKAGMVELHNKLMNSPGDTIEIMLEY